MKTYLYTSHSVIPWPRIKGQTQNQTKPKKEFTVFAWVKVFLLLLFLNYKTIFLKKKKKSGGVRGKHGTVCLCGCRKPGNGEGGVS